MRQQKFSSKNPSFYGDMQKLDGEGRNRNRDPEATKNDTCKKMLLVTRQGG